MTCIIEPSPSASSAHAGSRMHSSRYPRCPCRLRNCRNAALPGLFAARKRVRASAGAADRNCSAALSSVGDLPHHRMQFVDHHGALDIGSTGHQPGGVGLTLVLIAAVLDGIAHQIALQGIRADRGT